MDAVTGLVQVHVALDCGHDWRETRPAGVALPVNGELRACGHPEHYPRQYPAAYSGFVELCKMCGGPLPGPDVGNWGPYCSGACEMDDEARQ